MKLFSYRDRPVHLGPFPLETLARTDRCDLTRALVMQPPSPDEPAPESMAPAIRRFVALMDTLRDGPTVHGQAEIPDDPVECSNHLKAAGYYFDASMVGVTALSPDHALAEPFRNPAIDDIKAELEGTRPQGFAAGLDATYADILAASRATLGPIDDHTHALVFLIEYAREPGADEPGADWIHDIQADRAALLNGNVAVIIASYLRLLGATARTHTTTTSDLDLGRLAISAGLCTADGDDGELIAPFVGRRFGLAAVSTNLVLAPDRPLGPAAGRNKSKSQTLAWQLGKGTARRAATATPYAKREFRLGPHPFETIKRRDTPTTLIDEDRVPRFPKRADFFARALFGDMGKAVQEQAKGGYYVLKSPIGACARRALSALVLFQYGEARGPVSNTVADPARNADNIKAASYFLATDAVGLSRCPDWAYYSHNAGGVAVDPYHDSAITMLFDQGHETMEGASGDDWISVAQSMRAYLRFSLIGGVIAEHIRRLGYSARVHSVLDSDVLQPPLLLLSGLGEVSRIGEVILNPYLGPRLKSGVVTTSMPMAHDRPIDFGLQNFCQNCNKCARECPAGAITAGPKLMYNGYEIWKSDAEKCARYRLTNTAGGMCGRCMKTCPWNLEGLFADSAFRWLATNAPASAKTLAKLDDRLGRGTINPVKKWWWDIELNPAHDRYIAAPSVNARGLSLDLDLQYEDQTLAVYPADVMPPPFPIVHPLDREAGITRYRTLISPDEYRDRLDRGDTAGLTPGPQPLVGPPPAFPVQVSARQDLSDDIVRFELTSLDGKPLPPFEAGAHIDVVIAPEYQRQYSLAGDPADASKYVLGIQSEATGRGGSLLMHRVFQPGRRIFITEPRNHFPLDETAPFTLLMGGGIGITPLITMAHRLHALDREFIIHYSASTTGQCAFAAEIKHAPWADRAFFHITSEGNRADFAELIPNHRPGFKLYTCGADRYMDAVFSAAAAKDWPDDTLAKEFFSVPEPPDYVNHPFTLELAKSGKTIVVPEDQSATEVLAEHGIIIDTKCSDGICGVCATRYLSGEVEHRDYVLSQQERQEKIILCCSRAKDSDATLVIEL